MAEDEPIKEKTEEPVEPKVEEPKKEEAPKTEAELPVVKEPKAEPPVVKEPKAKPEPVEKKPAKEAPVKDAPKEEAPAEKKVEEVPKEEKPKPAKKEAKPKKPAEKKAAEKPAPAKEKAPVEEKKPAPKDKIVGIPPNKLLLFDKYDLSEIVVSDAGLARYINLDPVMVPHTGARHANRPFAKSKMNIVERLVNNMMRTEDYTGKKSKTYKVVMTTFDIIERKTKKNPVQILIEALENTTPREEVTRLRYGGVSVPKAVDISSARRLDIALRNICKGAVKATYKNSKSIETCLANELMLAAKGDMNSAAIAKKEEVERIAASAR